MRMSVTYPSPVTLLCPVEHFASYHDTDLLQNGSLIERFKGRTCL